MLKLTITKPINNTSFTKIIRPAVGQKVGQLVLICCQKLILGAGKDFLPSDFILACIF